MSITVKEWIDALMSDEYTQGNGRLRDKYDRFCCLGVACDLYAKKGKGEWATNTEYDLPDGPVFVYKGTVSTGNLNLILIDELSLTPDITQALITLNDTEQEDFKQIARYIADIKNLSLWFEEKYGEDFQS